ncbi:AAA family ATPase [Pseudomonas sp. PA27(2017)]|uniref:AAA family ATPase n=1 Tax=Pseudomonas sp. PA27(2017) TaxID=1932112 RepID=UPI0009622CF8|nr:AAA family ATPase [Pseudomonas sp. PA27(2017)]OLU35627.1 kinase [Pseudomonas sp. PA27(2017)]
MLIVLSGLPGTGKTTLAKVLAAHLEAVYLRIDSIEQALRNSTVLSQGVGSSGYQVANAIALDNLKMGRRVIADCVNPVEESRQAWADTAAQARCPLLNVRIICSDPDQHRRRVESRISDVPGLVVPDWQSVMVHEYEPWLQAPLTLDTAQLSTDAALALLIEHLTAYS